MRQGEQLDRDLAGGANVAALLQRIEDAPVGGAREQLIAVDEIGERHRLSPQRADDVPVVHHVSALVVRDGAAAPQGRHRRHAEEAFEPVVEDAHAQAMPDQSRGHGVEHAPQDEAARRVTGITFSSKSVVRALGSGTSAAFSSAMGLARLALRRPTMRVDESP